MFDDWEQNVTQSELEKAMVVVERKSVMQVMFVLQRLGLVTIEESLSETIIKPTETLKTALNWDCQEVITWSDSGVPSVKQR
jgi:hypothetical protein